MPRLFRKSKLPTDAPAPALRPPAKLVQNLTSLPQGGPAALAASSTAITLPVGSTLSNIRDPSTDGTTARGRDRGWQTAYSAAKMAVEIAKESSDMFLPLKAVVGAMSVLIKSYDVSLPRRSPEHLLMYYLFHTLANIRQCGECERDSATGTVAVWCSRLSCERG